MVASQLVTDGADRERLQAIARATAQASHDLNNLVSVVLGYANLLIDQVPPDSPAQRMAQEVQTAAYQAADLTRQLSELRRQQHEIERTLVARAPAPVVSSACEPATAPRDATTVPDVED